MLSTKNLNHLLFENEEIVERENIKNNCEAFDIFSSFFSSPIRLTGNDGEILNKISMRWWALCSSFLLLNSDLVDPRNQIWNNQKPNKICCMDFDSWSRYVSDVNKANRNEIQSSVYIQKTNSQIDKSSFVSLIPSSSTFFFSSVSLSLSFSCTMIRSAPQTVYPEV